MRFSSLCRSLIPSFGFFVSIAIAVYIFMIARSIPFIPGRTLFVIAHPDDEVLFFGPSILRSEIPFILSISSGAPNPTLRASEFYASCEVLGLRGRCFIDEANALPDGFAYDWPRLEVRRIISKYAEVIQPTRIVTFDRYGVSKHPNHIAIWRALVSENGTFSERLNVPIFWLRTGSIFLKYTGGIGAVAHFLTRKEDGGGFFVVTPGADVIGMKLGRAFMQHKSQQVWYRMLWLVMSQFMYFNCLVTDEE
jgi:N-acetylglucosaminylphosphatidylinositol deacetylase